MTPYLICPVGAQHHRQLSLFDVDTTCEPNSVFTLKEIQVRFIHTCASLAIKNFFNFYSFIIDCLLDCGNAFICLPVSGPRVHNERNLQRRRSLWRFSRIRLQESVQAEGKKIRYEPKLGSSLLAVHDIRSPVPVSVEYACWERFCCIEMTSPNAFYGARVLVQPQNNNFRMDDY